MTTLILSALRTRHRVLGMFVAILDIPSASGWDANAIVLATHLSCVADTLLTEQLTIELQDHNRKLDSLVLQRTQELLEAKDAAELANRAKSSFLATVSHELRTPLNAILGYTQILLNDSLSPDHHDQIATIHQAGEHLLALINDLLDISKAEAASIEVVPVRIRLAQIIEETAAIIRPRAEEKGLHFQCTVDGRLPQTITADPKRLKQVLLNLLSNATKFTSRGFVHLAVSRKPGCIRFLVSDTGSGIAGEDLPRLFQPFQQLANSARCTEGTGLGLSVCKRILEVLGVQLLVRSELGKGSSFWFDLPCDCPEGGPAATAPPVPTPPPLSSPSPPPPAPADPPIVLPASSLRLVKDLAADGDILGLQRELEAVLVEFPAASPFISRLLQLAVQCRIKAVRETIDDYERQHSPG
jgi:signal transduction histidine kinase